MPFGAIAIAAPDVPAMLGVDRAAMLLGVTPRHLRRLCGEGKIASSRDASGNWLIETPAEQDVAAAGTTFDFVRKLTAAKRSQLHHRRTVVAAFNDFTKKFPVANRTDLYVNFASGWNIRHSKQNRLSPRTIQRWLAAYETGGLAGLVDSRRYTGDSRKCSQQAWEAFLGLYLDESRPAVPRIYEIVAAAAAQNGWNWPSLRAVQRRLAATDPKVLAAGRDPKRFRDRCLPYAVRDWSQVPAMGCWVADHRQFDVVIPRLVDGKWRWHRPWLTMFLDARTWYPAAWTIQFDAPDGNRVMETFIAGVAEHGAPQHAYLDNGKDFRMKRFSGGRDKGVRLDRHAQPILNLLGISATFALPYNAKAKCVEAFFSLVSKWFDRSWPTYWGERPDRRPERIRAIKPEKFAEMNLTIEAFSKAFDAWLTADYSLRKSPAAAAGGLAPAVAFQTLRDGYVASRPSQETLALLLMPSVPVRVDANGVYVRAFGGWYWSDKLEDRRAASGRDAARKVVYRYCSSDPSAIYVFDAQSDRFLCVATPYVGGGIHPLAGSAPDADGVDRLATQIAARRRLARDKKAAVEALRAAGNKLLPAALLAADSLGLLTVQPPFDAAHDRGTIKFMGQLDAAAQAGRRHKNRRLAAGPDPRDLLATGTDDSGLSGRSSAEPIDLLQECDDGHQQSDCYDSA